METEKAFLRPEPEIKKEVTPELRNEPEVSELQREGGRIYSEEYGQKLNDILEHKFVSKNQEGKNEEVVLKDIVDKHLKNFASPEFSVLPMEEKAEKQREFVKDLGRGINSIPGDDPWSFYFRRIMETGRMNCSGSTALAGMILENTKEQSGIKSVEYGAPFGHAVNIITFGDNQLYWADARNGVFENISDCAKVENHNGLKIYKIDQPNEKADVIYRTVPSTSMKEGIISSYLENLHSAYAAAEGKFDKALKMGRSKEELKEIQKTAREVCQERELTSPEQLHHLRETRKFFTDKMNKYDQSKEFKEEAKRIEKIINS